MNCSACNFENPDGFKFCGACGAQLQKAATIEAERRQITVMFCDLVGSTDLSAAIDPEDLRELVRGYQAICAEVFEKNHGHVAQYLGDGILAYFGYPVAYEDSTARAVESALEIHQRIEEWNQTVPQEIEIRTGIHTGTVVVGEMGAGAHRENLAMGETPNLAARLQGVARPGDVIISRDTNLLVCDRVSTESLGTRELKGLPVPVEVFLVKQTNDPKARRRMERARRSRFPLLGYEAERERLWREWKHACGGEGRAVALVGEAGIGKSRLLQWLKDRVFNQDCYVVSLYPTTSVANTPLGCILEHLAYELPEPRTIRERCPGFPQAELLEELLGFREARPALGRQRLRLRALVEFWKEMASQRPLLVACDGGDHLDSASEEVLELLREGLFDHPILLLTTWRKTPPEKWGSVIQLNGLKHDDLVTLAKLAARQPLSPKQRHDIATRAEGNPFFAEELALNPDADSASRLKDLLMARLDSFGSSKPVVQRLSTVGRRFPVPVLEALSRALDEPISEVAETCLRERVLEREATDMAFCQGLFHTTCYQSLLRKSRQQFHSDVARAILSQLPEWQQEAPEILSYHLLHGEEPQQAVPFLHEAGRKALRMSAEREAAHYLSRALELLPESPETVSDRLHLLLYLGTALIATKGYSHPEVRQSFQKARDLCAALGDPPPTFPALCGLWTYAFACGELVQAQQLANRLLELADGEELARLLVAHATVGQTCFIRGEFEKAREHFEAVRRLHQPEYHASAAFSYFTTDPTVATYSYFAFLEHLEGNSDKRDALARQALSLAEELDMAHTLAHTYFYDAWLAYEAQDQERFERRIAELGAAADLYGFPLWAILAGVLQALSQQDPALYLERLAALEQTGTKLGETWFVANVYRLLSAAGQNAPAQAALDQVKAIAEEREERFFLAQLLPY